MGKGIRYSTEFKQEAVNKITVHGYAVADVAQRLGISTKTLYNWIQTYSKPTKQRVQEQDLQAEIARLKRELKRAQQERDILKEAAVDSIDHCNTLSIMCDGVLNFNVFLGRSFNCFAVALRIASACSFVHLAPQ